jgi:hypothetical protein
MPQFATLSGSSGASFLGRPLAETGRVAPVASAATANASRPVLPSVGIRSIGRTNVLAFKRLRVRGGPANYCADERHCDQPSLVRTITGSIGAALYGGWLYR